MDDTELLEAFTRLGLDSRHQRALLLLPLVEVAWTDGVIHDAERRLILDMARERGFTDGVVESILDQWLTYRPSSEYLAQSKAVLKALLARGELFSESVPTQVVLNEITKALAENFRNAVPEFVSHQGEENLIPWEDDVTDVGGLLPSASPLPAEISHRFELDPHTPPRIVVLDEHHPTIFTLPHHENVVLVGRRPSNHLQINWDRQVSREHLKLIRREKGWYAVDCQSNNGTFVNGEAIAEYPLVGGEEIRIGDTWLRFEQARSTTP